ncbi:hypothetical protein HHI36_001374 [Cryptolaemus montrouzieri]|uniref:Flavin-containing monooxygenase n=1 Tax=Cryptolaemus montrouzieri TaxID=559131 RepID=A0ABD2P875_9CUCU
MEKIEQSVVCFEDGSKEQVDDIILCTGYLYSFPFLSNKCKIVVDDNYIKGLFKECLCIEYPTLMFLGLPGQVCPIPTSEVQMRFFMSLMKGNFRLPCKEDMWEEDNYRRQAKNCTNRQFHKKGAKNERIYWDELAMTASVNTVPYVITKLHEWIVSNKRNITQSFRIVNDEEFERIA